MWAKDTVSKLIELVASGDSDAYTKLTHISSKRANSIPILLENLNHQDRGTRQAIAIGLANFKHIDFDPKWDAEQIILNCINTNSEDFTLKSALLLVLGSIGSQSALTQLFNIACNEDSFTRSFALSAIGQSGALSYFLIDSLHQRAQSSNDTVEKSELGKCMWEICQEVCNLAFDKSQPLDLNKLFIHPNRFINIPDKPKTSKVHNEDINVIVDDRINFSINGMHSACRLTILSVDNQIYCAFTRDEFSIGTSPTNSIEYLIAAVLEKFDYKIEDIVFLERYERAQFGSPEATMEMVVLDQQNPKWLISPIFMADIKKKLTPYFNQTIPIPSEVDLQNKLQFYLPPCSRQKS